MFKNNNFTNLSADLKSGFVVSLVALPLCLGIALASGAPLLSGLIAGIIGGIVVGTVSGSHVSVSGPAAGLAVIILGAISDLGSFELFVLSVMIAGFLQLTMGVFKLGGFSKWIHHSVIEGMLAAIGVLIIIKQIPYALGMIDFKSYSSILKSAVMPSFNLGALVIGLLCLGLIIIYNMTNLKKNKIFLYLPLSILLVIISTLLAFLFTNSSFGLDSKLFVNLGGITNGLQVFTSLKFPDFSSIFEFKVLKYGIIVAIVASIETILCIQAGDKLDQLKRKTSPNQELIAQGIGNMISGLLGGLPVTSVIVRTSVNIQSGARTKLSAIFHGMLLLIGLLVFPTLITKIPLAVLACILLLAGYNLAHPKKILATINEGYAFYIPFFVTVIVVVLEDLLIGVLTGQVVAVLIVFISSLIGKNKNGIHKTTN